MKIFVRVKSKSKVSRVTKKDAQHFEVLVKEPPVDGKANREALRLLADHLGVLKSGIAIVSGHSSRDKIIEIIPKH